VTNIRPESSVLDFYCDRLETDWIILLEIHILQLEQFEQSPDTLTEPLQEWLYFLKHGDELDPEQLPKPLNRPTIRHAAEELAMITKRDPEKERYVSRRKAIMDQNSFIRAAQEGKEQALAKGESIGEIKAFQTILGLPVSDRESLKELSI